MPEYEPTSLTPEQPKSDDSLQDNSEAKLSFEPFDAHNNQYIKDLDKKISDLIAEREKFLELTNGNSAVAMPGENGGQDNHELGNNSNNDLIARMHANLEAQRSGVIQADEKINQSQAEQS